MNSEQHQNPLAGEITTHAGQLSTELALSAMVDGEISAADLDGLLGTLEGPAGAYSSWHAYQVIGDVLRGNGDPISKKPASDFLAAVRIGLDARDIEPVALSPLPVTAEMPGIGLGREPAANDVVFRWKLVAGFASLAAVMAVSWSVVAGSGAGSEGAADAQLASAPPAIVSAQSASAASTAAPVTAPVLVSTGQGLLIRDAQLEALLAEHRQNGGMSALQMPSGFIRNATYEAAGR